VLHCLATALAAIPRVCKATCGVLCYNRDQSPASGIIRFENMLD
jgi:hypothetical protein